MHYRRRLYHVSPCSPKCHAAFMLVHCKATLQARHRSMTGQTQQACNQYRKVSFGLSAILQGRRTPYTPHASGSQKPGCRATNRGGPAQRHAGMLRLLDHALEHRATCPTARNALRVLGRATNTVICHWQSQPKELCELQQDLRTQNAGLDRGRIIVAHFEALVSASRRRLCLLACMPSLWACWCACDCVQEQVVSGRGELQEAGGLLEIARGPRQGYAQSALSPFSSPCMAAHAGNAGAEEGDGRAHSPGGAGLSGGDPAGAGAAGALPVRAPQGKQARKQAWVCHAPALILGLGWRWMATPTYEPCSPVPEQRGRAC